MELDDDKIRAEAAAGKTMTTIAREAGVARSTIARRLRNGANHSAGLDEVERLLNAQWQKLSVAERLRVFLK
jgi:DNA-binding phage protein